MKLFIFQLADTGIILQRVSLLNADIRFKQTVEAFSLHIFLAKYKIMPMGLWEINMSLMHDVSIALAKNADLSRESRENYF